MNKILNYGIVTVIALLSIAWRDYNLNTFVAPGLEFVTVLAIVCAILLPRPAAIAVPLVTVAIGDFILGSYSGIFLFVWSAWVAIAVGALILRKADSKRKAALYGAGVGIASSTLFFIVTNFGAWFIGRGEWYANSIDGLISSYVMGIPFYLTPLAGNLILAPLFAVGAYVVKQHQFVTSTVTAKEIA